jgi:hypothetical protein
MPKPLVYITLFLFACHSSVKYPPGGYDYPEVVADKDTNFYRYPLKNQLSRGGSFQEEYTYLYFRQFDEPNLGIRPLSGPVFRFSIDVALGVPVIITVTENEIVVKKGFVNPNIDIDNYPDTTCLTPVERWHLRILTRYYPLDENRSNRTKWRQHFLDSIGKVYPQLCNVAYFRYLVDKQYENMQPRYRYTTKKIPISTEQYQRLVRQINTSGYWQLPISLPCIDPPMDGFSFSLEANTPRKYNFVSSGSCDSDSALLFDKACQELIDLAQMKKELPAIYHDPVAPVIKTSPPN